jgi:uncharacterized alkaline shock family protein YloU
MAAISSDILASYAADAAREVDGVFGLAEHALHRHKGVRVLDEGDGFFLELHIVIAWGASIPAVGAAVQVRVAEYLRQMTDLEPDRVDVVVDEIAPH